MSLHHGKTMIVTGGAGAIGFATAKILAGEGANVLLVDIAGDRLEQRGKELRDRGIAVETICEDCSQEESVQRYVDAAVKKFGRIDGFFNNAGTEGKLAPTWEYDVEEFDRIIATNLRSMFLGLRYVLPVMVKQAYGAVVNTASIASERGLAGACAYNASKHGVVGLTRTAASEAGPKGVRVNCVMPGVIETPLLRGMLEQMFPTVEVGLDTLGKVATLNRVAQPDEVGKVVSFLLSNQASFVNGAAWEVDGGALATIRNDV
jgi:NAD(P)-dependent dehydrogenase (short-subunit alcohol dehydrogenase family)